MSSAFPPSQQRPDPKFHVSTMDVKDIGNGISIQMTFCGVAQYIDARNLVLQEGWEIVNEKQMGSKLVAIAHAPTVADVVDRMHEIGLSCSNSRTTLPARSLRL